MPYTRRLFGHRAWVPGDVRRRDVAADPYPRVNVALIGPADSLEPYPLGVGGALVDVAATTTGTIALLRNPGHLVTIATSGEVVAHPLSGVDPSNFAMGSERTFVGIAELASASGPVLPLPNLGRGSVIEALGPVAEFRLPAEPSPELLARVAAEEEVAALAAAKARGSDGGLPWTPIVIATLVVATMATLLLAARSKREGVHR